MTTKLLRQRNLKRNQNRVKLKVEPPLVKRLNHQKKRADSHLYNTSAWRKIREKVLADNPICYVCRKNLSTEADHIIPHRKNKGLFYDTRNILGICKSCHREKSSAGM